MLQLIFSLLMIQGSQAHEDEFTYNPSAENLISVQSLRVDNQIGDVFVIVRNDGHLLGHPYIIELRPNCGGVEKDWKKLKVADSQSACFVMKGTESVDPSNKTLSLKIYEANSVMMNVASMTEPVQGKALDVKPQCSPTATVFTFQLKNFCQAKPKRR